MNNILIYSDKHRNKQSLKECELIDNELLSLKTKYDCDTVIELGDEFDTLKPSSQELDQFAHFIKLLNCDFIAIAANSHESTTEEQSILNHYGILSNKVKVVKEFKDGNHLYCGHFSIKESSSNYDAKLSKEDLKDYLYVFLGHVHTMQTIKPNILHVGSCRYVNFDEAKDKQKIVVLITNYGDTDEMVHFLKLKSPIHMISLELSAKDSSKALQSTNLEENVDKSNESSEQESSISQAQKTSNQTTFDSVQSIVTYLDSIDKNTKVKVKILDFEAFRQFLPFVDKYANKFEVFRYVTEFEIIPVNNQKCKDTETVSFKEAFKSWLEKQTVDNSIKSILLKEIE